MHNIFKDYAGLLLRMESPSLTILIPAYNEEKLLESTVLNLKLYLDALKSKQALSSYEIIICINASTDKTEEIAQKLSSEEVRYFTIPQKGMGIALTEGLKRAKSQIITFISADGEILLDFIDTALPLMSEYQLLNCSRFITSQPHGSGFVRSFLSQSFREFFRLMFKYKFTEVGSGKVFRRDAADILIPHLRRYDGSWQMDVLYYALKYKLKVSEIPLNVRINRPSSESKAHLLEDSWYFFSTCLKYGVKNWF